MGDKMLMGMKCRDCGSKKVYARLTKRLLTFGFVQVAIRCSKCLNEYTDDVCLLGIENDFDYKKN